MKETVLRVLHSTTTKEPIHALTRRQDHCIFHCSVPVSETLLQEEINCGQTISLRIRQLSNPPPEISLSDSYKTVTKLELSCAVEVSWVFSICSILPALNIVRFGSSCFEFPFGACPVLCQSWITKSHTVRELIISFDHRKLLQDDFDKPCAIQTLNTILEYSTNYFTSLTKADLCLPVGVMLDQFLRNNPFLAETGEKSESQKLGTIQFRSYAYSEKPKKGAVPPILHRRDSCEPALIPAKRTRSDTTEFSSEADEDYEDGPVPGKSRIALPRSPQEPYFSNLTNSSYPQLNHCSNVPQEFEGSSRRQNGSKDSLRQESPPIYGTPYTDFSQMYTRRRN